MKHFNYDDKIIVLGRYTSIISPSTDFYATPRFFRAKRSRGDLAGLLKNVTIERASKQHAAHYPLIVQLYPRLTEAEQPVILRKHHQITGTINRIWDYGTDNDLSMYIPTFTETIGFYLHWPSFIVGFEVG